MWRRVNRPMKPVHGLQRSRATVLALLFLVFVVAALVFVINGGKPSSPFGLPKLKWNSFQTSVEFRPSVEFMNGTDLIWQIPDSPKAVLFIAHGCNGRAANFWDRSPGCPNCVGLPEERLIVLHALDRKFALLTVSSVGRCWSLGKEMENVQWIIKRWIEKHGLDRLPITAMGASSGGYFVSALAAEMKFSSIVLMIAEGVFEEMGVPEGYPPTLFVHMPKDRLRMKSIEMNMKALRQKNVDVREIRCMEFPLTPKFLSDRIPGMDENFSGQLFSLLREKDFINENGYMRKDGRKTPWKEALRERGLLSERYEWDIHIQEELNLAFGYHEMTSLQSDDMLEWFESHMSR